ncbi:MAG: hypothetical protein ACI9U2_000179, partial [Bradymonadia bacterium]
SVPVCPSAVEAAPALHASVVEPTGSILELLRFAIGHSSIDDSRVRLRRSVEGRVCCGLGIHRPVGRQLGVHGRIGHWRSVDRGIAA